MSTVNFSVPERIKKAFNKTFADENKSAVLARLMENAVEERARLRRRAAAIDRALKLRRRQKPVTDAAIRKARRAGRP